MPLEESEPTIWVSEMPTKGGWPQTHFDICKPIKVHGVTRHKTVIFTHNAIYYKYRYSHASGVPWRITGSGLDDWIYWHFYYSLFITINYNSANRWLPKTRSIPSCTTSVFYWDWLGSDLRVGHFFSFRCPLVNTPQLNTQSRLQSDWILFYEWLPTDSSFTTHLRMTSNELSFITRGEPNRDHHLENFVCYYLFHPLLRNMSISGQRFDFYRSIRCYEKRF
jgi:hypothetical protein